VRGKKPEVFLADEPIFQGSHRNIGSYLESNVLQREKASKDFGAGLLTDGQQKTLRGGLVAPLYDVHPGFQPVFA
jgi:hypothetical protein